MYLEINIIELDPNSTQEDPFGGDAHFYAETTNKRSAFAHAKKASSLAKAHEAEVRQYDNSDRHELLGHWYFANGKLKT